MLRHHELSEAEFSFLNSRDCIYHFTRKSSAIEGILYENKLRFGRFSSTNDPWEYSEKLWGVSGTGIGRELMGVALQIKDLVDQITRKNTGFLSFCQNEFDHLEMRTIPAFVKSRMWSQYGESHGGVCLAFSKTQVTEIVASAFPEEKYVSGVGEVTYDDLLSRVENLMEFGPGEIDSEKPEKTAREFLRRQYDKLVFLKQTDYRDEGEFRVCVTTEANNIEDLQISLGTSLRGVILGDKFHPGYLPSTKYLCRNLRVPLFLLSWHHGGYAMLRVSQDDKDTRFMHPAPPE